MLTQKQMVIKYLEEFDFITPAKKSGSIYMGQMWGSEISRVCRTLRREGKLDSERDHHNTKFMRFYLKRSIHTTQPLKDNHSAKYHQIQDDIANSKLQPSLSI